MSQADPFAAELLERSAAGFATAAALRLIEQQPGLEARYAPGAAESWKRHLNQRILELSAAAAVGSADMFINRVVWSRKTFEARELQPEDLEASLVALQDVLSEKLPAEAQGTVLQFIRDARSAVIAQPDAEDSLLDPSQLHDRLALRYLHCAIEGNVLPAMEVVLDALEDNVGVQDAILRVLLPAQMEIGRLWHLDQVSVAEEHLVTTTTQRLMAVLASRARRRRDNGRTAVAAAVAGNVHDVGIRAIAYLLEMDGWRTIYLGSDVPRGDLPATVQFFDADVILLSCALSVQLKTVRQTIAAIRERAERDVKIMVGGLAFYEAPELWQEIGADGYAPNATEALTLANQFFAAD
jgi:methanogenic corrinoid protein MtbC1